MARHTTGTRTQLKTFSRRDIAVWQQESPSLQGGEDVKATLNNSARHCEADSIYQNYCFGDGVQVAGQDGWEYTTPGDVWTRKVYVETEDSEASQKLDFTIRFGTGDAPEAYAIDSKGNIWGTQE